MYTTLDLVGCTEASVNWRRLMHGTREGSKFRPQMREVTIDTIEMDWRLLSWWLLASLKILLRNQLLLRVCVFDCKSSEFGYRYVNLQIEWRFFPPNNWNRGHGVRAAWPQMHVGRKEVLSGNLIRNFDEMFSETVWVRRLILLVQRTAHGNRESER